MSETNSNARLEAFCDGVFAIAFQQFFLLSFPTNND